MNNLNLLQKVYESESLTVPNHVTQMKMWMVRQGIELLAGQDTPKRSRQNFIDRIWRDNKMDLYLAGIAELFVLTGGILWFLTPTQSGYLIYWFHSGKENNKSSDFDSQYRVYYNPSNPTEIDTAIIRYSFIEASQHHSSSSNEKWVRLYIQAEFIRQEIFESMPPLLIEELERVRPRSSVTYKNSFGFVPVFESPNHPYAKGDPGISDFSIIQNPLRNEEELTEAIGDNVYKYGNATLITSRQADEVFDSLDRLKARNMASGGGWARSQGYFGSNSDYWAQRNKTRRRDKLPSVIGGITEGEKLLFVTPDPISPDQQRYLEGYRIAIHNALGGIDPNDASFSTFGEVKTLHGKVAVTALTKCNALWKWGLCELFKRLILFEEDLFMVMFRYWLGQVDKKIDLTKVTKANATQLIFDQGVQVPFDVGMVPYGDVEVLWRYNGDVFEDSPLDKQQKSIMVRNLQELGVGSLEALDELYPNLSDREKRRKLTGVPFRIVNQCTTAISSLLSIQQQMVMFPDDQDPTLTLATTSNITPIIKRILQILQTELNYGIEYSDTQNDPGTTSIPATSSASGTDGESPGASDSSTDLLPTDWNKLPISPGATVRSTQHGGVHGSTGSATLRPTTPIPSFQPYYIRTEEPPR